MSKIAEKHMYNRDIYYHDICKRGKYMKNKEIEQYKGQKAKLTLFNDYILTGKIEKICDDHIFFDTSQNTSIIRLNAIKEIVI